jgi:hypothetical protein
MPLATVPELLSQPGWTLLVGFTVAAVSLWALIAWLAAGRPNLGGRPAPIARRAGDRTMRWIVLGGLVIPGILFVAALMAARLATTGVVSQTTGWEPTPPGVASGRDHSLQGGKANQLGRGVHP